jgi:hypothetical protein
VTKNELAVLLRQTKRASEEAIARASAAESNLAEVKGSLAALERAFQGGAMKPLTNRERALAACRDMRPTWFVLTENFAVGANAVQEMERQTDTVGRMIVDRIRATWRDTQVGSPTEGMFGLISSAQAGDIDHLSLNIIDFEFQLVDGRNNQYLQNEPIPSDVLARSDGDGFPAGGLVFEPGTDVRIILTPLRDMPSDGIITFILEGIQCYDQKGAP